MEVDLRFKEWFGNQSKTEKIEVIKKHSIRLNSLHKSLIKANEAEHAYGFNRIGIRGGKLTSLNAKADNCARMYDGCEIELKYMIRNL